MLTGKTRADLGWDHLLAHLAQRSHTDRGAALCRALEPLGTIEDALARQAEVSEARALQDSGEPIGFGGITDLTTALGRAGKGGVLTTEELGEVRRTLQAGARLRHHLQARAERTARLLGRAALIAELVEVSGPIDDALDDGGQIRDTASPALRGLRQRTLALQDELSRRADGLLAEGHIAPYLQDRFVTQRDERYVVPVRADARARVRGIVHGTSASGATVFVEPEEIIDLNNRLKLAQLEVADEERRILQELSQGVERAAPRIAQNLEVLTVLDLIDAAARLSSDLRASPVALTPAGEGGIDLRNARHPLLHLSGIKVVPSDIIIPPSGTLVVSGPNAGGKTVALKLAGLCALLARCGLHGPVQEGSSLPWFAEVLTDIGDDQSIERNLSTFSAHVLNLCRFIQQAGPATLILLDEVAAGTDPEQGAALAQAVLEALSAARAMVIVTTHYDRLKALGAQDPRFVNASVGYDLDRMAPTFRLHLGVPGASGAMLVAQRLGLPTEIVKRAGELCGDRQAGVEALLQALSRERENMLQLRAQAEAEHHQAAAEAQQAVELREQAQKELRKARQHAHDEAIGALRKARLELDEARAALRRGQEPGGQAKPLGAEGLAQARQQVDRLSREIAQSAPEPPAPAGSPARPEDLVPGARVIVPRLGGVGTVMSDIMRDKVVVQVGALKLNVDIKELRIPGGAAARQAPKAAAPAFAGPAPKAAAPPVPLRTPATTIDLRGERMEIALARTEKFVDDALRDQLPAVFVLHGHGTGILRNAIRGHFGSFPGVSRLYPAPPEDGGDGVTVLELQ